MAGIFDQISQVLGMGGQQDAAQMNLPQMQQTEIDPQNLPSFAPRGQFDPGAVQQLQQTPEAPMGKVLNGGDESSQQRMLLLSAALMSPGNLADKLRMAALSQAAYTEMQGAAGRDDLYKQSEQERLRLDSESNRTLRGAQTKQVTQATEESAAKAPHEIAKLKSDAEKAEIELTKAQRAWQAAMKLDPTGEKTLQAEMDLKEAQIKYQRAHASQASASAGESSARTAGVKQVNDARAILADPKSTPEQRDQAQVVVNGGKSPAGQKKDHLDVLKRFIKEANPEMSDVEAAQQALEAEAGTKGSGLRAAIALYNNDPNDAEAKAYLQQELSKNKGKAPAAGKPVTGAITEGTIAKNAKGERIIFTKGAWAPYTGK